MSMIYEDLVKELEGIDYKCNTFPILLYQNATFRETIYLKINKLCEKNTPIFPADLFFTTESKVLLNEMFEYWSGLEGCLKAIKRIDENMKEVINYECERYNEVFNEVILEKYEMYYKRLTSKNRKRLFAEYI